MTPRAARRFAWVCGLFLAALGVALSFSRVVAGWDENRGLPALFKIRGPVPAPGFVSIVAISRETAAKVGQPDSLNEWLRDSHAEVVKRLRAAGAALIVFDIFFKEAVSAEDEAFAAAIEEAGNVILVNYLASVPDGVPQRNRPLAILADAALGTADFVVPDIDGVRVMRYWTFGRAHDAWPSLPVLVAQAYSSDAYDDLIDALADTRPDLAATLPQSHRDLLAGKRVHEVMKTIREVFVADVALVDELLEYSQQMSPDRRKRFRSLVEIYGRGHDRYFNFLGPPGTVRTLAYEDVLTDQSLDLTGQIVFVGISQSLRDQRGEDEFFTPFSSAQGDSLVGVELAATAVANILEGNSIAALGLAAYRGVLAGFGLLLGLMMMWTYSRTGVYAGLVFSAGYIVLVIWMFTEHAVWWPVVVPIAVQLPIALGLAFAFRYRLVREQRERVQTALQHYLPAPLVARLSTETLTAVGGRELLHGTCLVTDVQGFTRVAETLKPQMLGELLDAYHETLFPAVTRHGGVIADIGGDAMVAVWAGATPDPRARMRACSAAVELLAAVDAFNLKRGSSALPTRVGLASGSMLLGNVGATQRLEFRAIGDIVNTASRIEGLNRVLGTRALASSAAIADTAVAAREIGTFILRGKAVPVTVHELREPSMVIDATLDETFARALLAFRAGSWAVASALFQSGAERFPNDGPMLYYATLAEHYRTAPPSQWAGAVEIATK